MALELWAELRALGSASLEQCIGAFDCFNLADRQGDLNEVIVHVSERRGKG